MSHLHPQGLGGGTKSFFLGAENADFEIGLSKGDMVVLDIQGMIK